MKIQATHTPAPKYPALAAVAVAATLAATSCQQQQQNLQPTAGAPLPPPKAQNSTPEPRDMQRTAGAKRLVFPKSQVPQGKPQLVPGKARVKH